MRLIFMGTPEAALPSLEQIRNSSHIIEAIFTQPDRASGRGRMIAAPPVKVWALEREIRVFQPESLKREESPEKILREIAPDGIVTVAYGLILPKKILEIPRHGCINLHFSLLPKYRGAAPVNWAIVRGEKRTGVTTFLMNEKMDEGDVLLQEETDILEGERADSLSRRLSDTGAQLLIRTLDQWEKGQIRPVPQDHSQATYAPIIKKENGKIDWSRTALEISLMVRGFHPWPGAFSGIRGRSVKIVHARQETDSMLDSALTVDAVSGAVSGRGSVTRPGTNFSFAGESGTIVSCPAEAIKVLCGKGTILSIISFQPEGRKEMTAREALNGRYLKVGDRFDS